MLVEDGEYECKWSETDWLIFTCWCLMEKVKNKIIRNSFVWTLGISFHLYGEPIIHLRLV